jgi:predicted PurR-regulated permease PerM
MHDPITQPAANSVVRPERIIALVIFALLLLACFAVLRPFLSALLWAVILGFSLWPIHRRLVSLLRGRRSLAALLTTGAITAALVVPLIITVANLTDDARDLSAAGRAWLSSGIPKSPAWVRSMPVIGSAAGRSWDDLAIRTNGALRSTPSEGISSPTTEPVDHSRFVQAARTLLTGVKTWVLALGLAIGEGVLQVVLALFLMFFMLRDGESLAARLRHGLLRIAGERGSRLLDVAAGTVRGVTYGILGTAAAQGLLAGIGFLIAGVPGASLLGLLTFFLSVVPMGPPLVWIPAVVWLFHTGSPGWGIFMIIWGLLVSSIDNVIKPLLISRGSNMPFLLIFLGVLGGALLFGLIGLFIGPTLLAVAYRVIDEWSGEPGATV